MKIVLFEQPLYRSAGLFVLLAMFFCLAADPAFGQYGKVQGTVSDARTGEPLPGVNVVIDGTQQGASTNLDGKYVIIGIRPGTYTLVASYVGFQTTRVENVRVQIDLTTEQDFQLSEQVVEGQEVTVIAQRPLVQKDLTATTSVVSGEEIASLPVENFSDVVNLQAGVVNGHFRGGRGGEVGYWVDGLPITDVFNGGVSIQIENDMVQEMQVVTGAFNAEFGQAMSGIVNVVTRDGSNKFSGSVSGFTGDYLSNQSSIFPNINSVGVTSVRNGELNLSGPIVKNRVFFFTSGRYFKNDGWLYGRRAFTAEDVGFDPSGALALIDTTGSGDSTSVAMNPYERMSGQAKLTVLLTNKMRLAANVIASQEDFRNYEHQLYFFPDAQLNRKQWGHNSYVKFTHTLSSRTFYEVGVTRNYSSYREYQFPDSLDSRYMDTENYSFSEPNLTSGFRIGGTNNSRFERFTDTFLGKADLTSQITRSNLVKFGVEARRHQINYKADYVDYIDQAGDRRLTLLTGGRYDYKPFEFAAYLQDKIELGSLIINAGLRFDYFDPNGRVLTDPADPNVVFEQNRPADINAFTLPSKTSYQISPRLGVAFPITSSGTVHFSYGHFFQIPNYEFLYQNPYFRLSNAGSGLIGLMGNANLEPEKTINGEIGLTQQVTSGSAVEFTVYYRDIRNLTGTATDPIQIRGTGARYGMLVNSDFGFVRGIVFRFDQQFGEGFFANADYTYQIAKSNASDPAQVYQAAAARQELEKQIVPTNWDQRHTVNVSLAYAHPSRWGFGLIAGFGSGEPYTPAQTTAQTGDILPSVIPLNSERKPVTTNINMNVYKEFAVLKGQSLQLFAKIDNLLDTRNEYGIFGDTGRATYSLQKNIDANSFVGDGAILDRWYTRPDFYSQPRRVVLGLTYSF